ncbi:hypothetical protein KTF37_29040 [Burkholderia multivorans]|uniref:hypothetical protein n=1 Tax=Burkholderia multivorans TaxID=87883 RepID=UPI001C2169F3|nr:hypothetical protein [Burkholderia multivorans]MBU9680898.1 hypothetical protein [Burkholderia multivorans]
MDYPIIILADAANTVTAMLLVDEADMGVRSTQLGETAYRYHSPVAIGATLPADAVPA